MSNTLKVTDLPNGFKSAECHGYKLIWNYRNLAIGCQSHRIEQWKRWEPKHVAAFDQEKDASAWWEKWKPVVMQTVFENLPEKNEHRLIPPEIIDQHNLPGSDSAAQP